MIAALAEAVIVSKAKLLAFIAVKLLGAALEGFHVHAATDHYSDLD